MNHAFVLLAEYNDDLQAELTRSMLYDADIPVEFEQEHPRGMAHAHQVPIRVMVPAHDLKRARSILRRGVNPFSSDAFGESTLEF